MKGILGRKIGMTTVFVDDGKAIPVTVIEVKPNIVLQVKNSQTDGYNSLMLGVEDKKENKVNKPALGIAKKAKTAPKYFIKEIRDMDGYNLGDKIDGSIFTSGSYVDVTGITKGKGFQGVIKRHNQSRGPMGHGSKFHRAPGSSGDIRGTVKRTKKMPGRMGTNQVTMQNLEVISINLELNSILIKGSIPGANKSFVVIKDPAKGQKSEIKAHKLVNIKEDQIKNELLEEGKKYSAVLNTTMSIEEMKIVINEAKITHEANEKEFEKLLREARELKINKANKMKLDELKAEIAKVKALVAARKAKQEGENNG